MATMTLRSSIERALVLAGTSTLVACNSPSPPTAYSCSSTICTGSGCTDYLVADVCAPSLTSAAALCSQECPAAADDCAAQATPTVGCFETGVLVRRDADMRFTVDETMSFAHHTDSSGTRLFEIPVSGEIYVSGSWCDGCTVTIDGIAIAQAGAGVPSLAVQPSDVTMTSTSHPSRSVSTAGSPSTFAGTVLPGGTLWIAYRAIEGGRLIERHLYNPGPVNFGYTPPGLVTSVPLGDSIDPAYTAVLILVVDNHRPVATSMVTYDAAALPPAIVLDGTGTTDADVGDTLTYVWNDEMGLRVGDGTVVSLPATSGSHTFTLTVVDSEGASSTDAQSVVVP